MYKYLWNHHHNQDSENIHHQKFPPIILQFLSSCPANNYLSSYCHNRLDFGVLQERESCFFFSLTSFTQHSYFEIQPYCWVYQSVSVQLLSRVWLFVTPWTAARQASLSITNSQCLLKLIFIESVMPFNHLIPCCPLLLPSSIFPSIRVFSNESVLHIRWPKDWSFSFSISPSNEYSAMISFWIDWLGLLAVQTLNSLLQYHSSKESVLWRSAFFIVQLSHPYMTMGKTIALTRWTFVGKVMSLLFNMLYRLVITFFQGASVF